MRAQHGQLLVPRRAAQGSGKCLGDPVPVGEGAGAAARSATQGECSATSPNLAVKSGTVIR